MRVWREFPTGPAGVFLKKGRDMTDWGFMRRPPFVWTTSVPDPDPSRYFYGKSFIYSAFAAPFVRVLRHERLPAVPCLLLALVAWCSYVFLLRADASGARRHAGGRLSDGVGRAGVLRVDYARALQLRARPAGVLLLALQAGRDA